MDSSLDLNLLPLQRQNGIDNPAFPGFFMATPPRRTARGRANDLLLIYLYLGGNASLEDAQYESILNRLGNDFYKTPGTVTAALKKLAENLNQILLNRNLRATSSGSQSVGLLTTAVLRGDRLTIAHSGPCHAFVVQADEAHHVYDPQLAGRGLGLTRSVSIRFSQAELKPNDVVIFTPQPPTGWIPSNLLNIHGQGMETLRRRLLSQAGADVNALVAHAQAGTGKLRMLRMKRPLQMVQVQEGEAAEIPAAEQEHPGEPPTSPPAPAKKEREGVIILPERLPQPENGRKQEEAEAALEAAEAEAASTGEQEPDVLGEPPAAIEETEQQVEAEPALHPKPAKGSLLRPAESLASHDVDEDFLFEEAEVEAQGEPPAAAEGMEAPAPVPLSESSAPIPAITPIKPEGAAKKASQAAAGAIKGIGHRILSLFAVLVKKILPDESLFTIPGSTMMFTAVAVAVVMAVAGAMVYFQRGYESQYNQFYEQAAAAAESVATQIDPIELRTSWDTAIFFLNQAEQYRVTSDSTALRQQAQAALDRLDYIYRLSFQNAFSGGLGGPVNITRLAATTNELYMLNANNGTVLRAVLTANGKNYEIDPDFSCSVYHSFGPIVSIIPGIRNDRVKAAIILMDEHGNLMYCNPGESAKTISAAPPHTNWGQPVSFTLDNGSLYVLDPGSNGVWFYRGMDVTSPPHLYFDNQVPKMKDVIDLAVNGNELYLLHSDGSISTCKYSALQESPTRCEDPAALSDPRPGRHSSVRIPDAQFSQMLFTPPPDPSIYLLDPINQSVYHFSLRLNLQRQFRAAPKTLASDTATAFTISPNRMLFMATGNQIYYAILP
jgi:hypothetical protein